MQLSPRYGTDPILSLDGAPSAIRPLTIRQRRRLATILTTLTPEQWIHPSRCAGWTVRDVIVHLDSTNGFWAYSVAQGLRGEPTRMLATFDPVASPAQMVAAVDLAPDDVLARFTESTESFAAILESLNEHDWKALAEAPPGHIDVSAVMHHALWDSWVHERDVLVPLGIAPAVEADEVAACVRYAAALGPALALCRGSRRTGVLAVNATAPDTEFSVHIDGERVAVRHGIAEADLTLTGDAVELVEAFSIRQPLNQLVQPDVVWLVDGLAITFDGAGMQ